METEVNFMPLDTRIQSDGVVYRRDSGERHPLSIVWTTLPGISFLIPLIGHVGITDSRGITYDFSGPYQVTVGSLMCGPAKRIWQLDETKIKKNKDLNLFETYDAAIVNGACIYGKQMHNLFVNNCHSHVATVLNELEYDGRTNWNQVRVFLGIWSKGKWVNRKSILAALYPFLIILTLILACAIIFPLVF